MAQHYGPNIVTDGLVLCLDAADKNSYPGSGTTWYDLSGNGYNGTMTNGPTFDSDGGGCLSFTAASTHYVDVTSPPGLKTYSSMCIWFNTGVDSEGLWDLSMSDASGQKNVDNFGPELNSSGYLTGWALSRNGAYPATRDDWTMFQVNTDFRDNTWHYLVNTFANGTGKTYVDGVYKGQDGAWAWYDWDEGTQAIMHIGKKYNYHYYGGGNANHPFTGKLNGVQLYHKTLSAEEVLHNFTVHRGRYGV